MNYSSNDAVRPTTYTVSRPTTGGGVYVSEHEWMPLYHLLGNIVMAVGKQPAGDVQRSVDHDAATGTTTMRLEVLAQ